MFGFIFNTYYGAPILCCTTTDLGIFMYNRECFGTVGYLAFLQLHLWKPWFRRY